MHLNDPCHVLYILKVISFWALIHVFMRTIVFCKQVLLLYLKYCYLTLICSIALFVLRSSINLHVFTILFISYNDEEYPAILLCKLSPY